MTTQRAGSTGHQLRNRPNVSALTLTIASARSPKKRRRGGVGRQGREGAEDERPVDAPVGRDLDRRGARGGQRQDEPEPLHWRTP